MSTKKIQFENKVYGYIKKLVLVHTLNIMSIDNRTIQKMSTAGLLKLSDDKLRYIFVAGSIERSTGDRI